MTLSNEQIMRGMFGFPIEAPAEVPTLGAEASQVLATANTEPSQPALPDPTPDWALPVDMAELGRTQPATATPAVEDTASDGLEGSRERLRRAYKAREAANQQAFDAESKGRAFEAEKAMRTANLDEQDEAVRQEMDIASREKAAIFRGDMEKQMEEAARAPDSTRYWHSRGGVHKAAGFITAFLGAFQGPDMRQNVNAIIDQAVSRDIDDQRAEIAASRQKITDSRELRQLDLREEQLDSGRFNREALVRKSVLVAELGKRAASLGDGVARANLQNAHAAAQAGLADDLNNIEGAEYTRDFQGKQADRSYKIQRGNLGVARGGLAFRKEQAVNAQANRDADRALAQEQAAAQSATAQADANRYADSEEVQGVVKGGQTIRMKEPKLRAEMQDRLTGEQQLFNATEELKRLVDRHGREAYGKHKARAKQLGAIIQRKLLESNKGPASDADAARVLQEFGFTPGSDGGLDVLEVSSSDKLSTRAAKLQNFQDLRKRNLNTYLKQKAPGSHFEGFDDLPEDESPTEQSSGDLALKMAAQTTTDGKVEVGESIIDQWSKQRAGKVMLAPEDPSIASALDEARSLPDGPRHLGGRGDLVERLEDIYRNGSPDYQAQAHKEEASKTINKLRAPLADMAKKAGY